MDAAILFSDILVVPLEMWLDIELVEKVGPIFKKTIKTKEDIEKLDLNAPEKLNYVYLAIKEIKKELLGETPLIWFAWAPFTILCYMIEWKWSKDFLEAKKFCFTQEKLALELLEKITTVTIEYLKKQIEAWVEAVQIFDSWSSALSPQDFDKFILPFTKKIVEEISPLAPIILFEKWSNHALEKLSKLPVCLWVDSSIEAKKARKIVWENTCLQGNFDPAYLFLEPLEIKKRTKKMIDDFWTKNYIANLWHWINQFTPIENVKAFIEAVKEYKK
jgi:uroporphyrinogen decarboxylase